MIFCDDSHRYNATDVIYRDAVELEIKWQQ